jgi:uncharacterized protein (TIGR02569 family)
VGEPSAAVLRAFGAAAGPVPLPGGRATVWRAGGVVLKPLDMSLEALEWQAGVLGGIDGAPDVRVAPPVRSADGRLAVDGWTAWRYEPGAPAGGRWAEVLAAGRALHRRLRACPRPSFLDRRDDAWARADRVAWGEAPPLAGHAYLDALVTARRAVAAPPQLVHGDLTDNVHLAPGLPPLVIDFSPYWRPAAFGTAVVVVDAVVFRGADTGLIGRTAAAEAAGFDQLLVRALLFRAVGDHLLAPDKAPVWAEMFAPAVATVLGLAPRPDAGEPSRAARTGARPPCGGRVRP